MTDADADADADMNTDMKVTSDAPTIPPVTDLEIGSFAPSEAAQGAVGQFLGPSTSSSTSASSYTIPPLLGNFASRLPQNHIRNP
jgi:hypothetical protein